ncbi:MAG: TonB family protein [Planctomycetes bacterium]|nr:TonB family protein [Planctomycetota bacterium]
MASVAVHALALAVVGAAVLAIDAPSPVSGTTLVLIDPSPPAPEIRLEPVPLVADRVPVALPESLSPEPAVPDRLHELPDLLAAAPPVATVAPESGPPSTLDRLPVREMAPPPAAATSEVAEPNGAVTGSSGPPEVRAAPDPDGCPLPDYPALARRRGWEGRTLLRVRVAPDGSVLSAEVQTGSGYEVLDRAAVEAIREWRLRPASRAGVPVEDVVEVPIRFRFEETP